MNVQIMERTATPPQHDVLEGLLARYQRAANARAPWLSLWKDCYDYTMPAYASIHGASRPDRRNERLFDGTAPDAVDQLSATLLNNLVPINAPWFSLRPGPALADDQSVTDLAQQLNRIDQVAALHFQRSNLTTALHQCLLDLVICGTACLLLEEEQPGQPSAFRFTAVPLLDAVLADSGKGMLDTLYRPLRLKLQVARTLYPQAQWPEALLQAKPDTDVMLLEAIEPRISNGAQGAQVSVVLLEGAGGNSPHLLHSRVLGLSPLLTMRWMKSPAEEYGRSPVMKALPDIKCANKVVELVLQNASIAVSGIWQADDDGVLNPANITLVPGSIIPKAVGSKGLTPLDMPGKFDISQLMLDDLRGRIRHALLVDRLPQATSRTMTATEVVARTAEMAVLLSGVYARLQAELLYPLVSRGLNILARRGEIPELPLAGPLVQLDIASPLVRAAAQTELETMTEWLKTVRALGADALAQLNISAVMATLGSRLNIPAALYTPNATAMPDADATQALLGTLAQTIINAEEKVQNA